MRTLKDALETLNTRKRTSRRVLTDILSNIFRKFSTQANLSTKRLRSGVLDRYEPG